MFQKEYPKTVVLKKNIVGIAVVGAALIITLILHNLYASTKSPRSSRSEVNSHVQNIATDGDTNWYQNKEIQKHDLVKNQIPYPSAPNTPSSVSSIERSTGDETTQDLQKAMRAPITSNQLTDNLSTQITQNTTVETNNSNSSEVVGSEQNMQGEKRAFLHAQSDTLDNDYLTSMLKNPITPFELQAGTIIPGVLITGINSDLPGQITGQVRSNVYDSISGKYLLIPQGSKLTGIYDSQVSYGQERVLVAWKRIIFPNGQSINLQGMPGVDMSGYAGFHDQVNNHYGRIFGSVVLMSLLSAGAQLSQPQNSNNPWQAPTVGQTIAQSLGAEIISTGSAITAKNINIQPTLEIRPGYEFNISVTKDMVFPSPYCG